MSEGIGTDLWVQDEQRGQSLSQARLWFSCVSQVSAAGVTAGKVLTMWQLFSQPPGVSNKGNKQLSTSCLSHGVCLTTCTGELNGFDFIVASAGIITHSPSFAETKDTD